MAAEQMQATLDQAHAAAQARRFDGGLEILHGMTHPRSGCVGILAMHGLWYRICPSRSAFGVEGAARRGARVLNGPSAWRGYAA